MLEGRFRGSNRGFAQDFGKNDVLLRFVLWGDKTTWWSKLCKAHNCLSVLLYRFGPIMSSRHSMFGRTETKLTITNHEVFNMAALRCLELAKSF